jgi:FMN phosphatase YigB (HAD superfamily)
MALNDYNIAISKKETERFQLYYVVALNSIQWFSEVSELLTTLRKKGFSLGVITNGPVEHHINEKIRNLGLIKFIPNEWIFISDAVGVAKTNP